MKLLDLTGKRFGSWTVMFRSQCSRTGTRWRCKCECGSEKDVLSTHLVQGNTTSCGCKIPKGNQKTQWSGYGEISGAFWKSIQSSGNGRRGKRKSIEFTITIEYIWDLFLTQERKCALTGTPITMSYRRHRYNGTKNSHTASLDRIDSSLGYVEGNVQWVNKDINFMKRTYDQEYFIEMCRKVTEYHDMGKDTENQKL